jgi:uncharacterized protein YdhG (YjbR/CyaY superfamily)
MKSEISRRRRKSFMQNFASVDTYIHSQRQEVRAQLELLRNAIRKEFPGIKETMSYKMPTFTWQGNSVYLAVWKRHISLYPFSSGMVSAFPATHVYKISGKGTIQFPLNKPLPISLIQEIFSFILRKKEGG